MPARTTATTRARRSRRVKASARRRTRARRTRTRRLGIAAAIFVPVVLFTGLLLGAGYIATALDEEFPDYGSAFTGSPTVSEPAVAGYGVEQLTNACTILAAGRDLGFDQRDQTIAVMTAMGESSLRNIDYGDWETSGVTNPDGSRTTSIGLFQQQDSWGPREARMDPYTSATVFYRAMADRVPDRAVVEPTIVAHRTQVNTDPLHYARFWDRAVRIVAAVTGTPAAGDVTEGIPQCPAP